MQRYKLFEKLEETVHQKWLLVQFFLGRYANRCSSLLYVACSLLETKSAVEWCAYTLSLSCCSIFDSSWYYTHKLAMPECYACVREYALSHTYNVRSVWATVTVLSVLTADIKMSDCYRCALSHNYSFTLQSLLSLWWQQLYNSLVFLE